ncbi:hypothetical protein BIKEJJ_13525 [Edwardsiella anguillarum]|uniref:Uncharacterized protein n=1 Tax=Edwardsiella anguillarum ET080813 TaxID=667120 RepID=A0A076LLG4_9GAMM|nr:Hypothetical protein ETEE_1064 [Edwardsiella anguillarum ET080813]BET91926.1 hypothetical protein BIKEJJ_13525 [Edwardsiella anguillarum]
MTAKIVYSVMLRNNLLGLHVILRDCSPFIKIQNINSMKIDLNKLLWKK